MQTHYTYSVDGYTYWLLPVFQVAKSGYVRLRYALMYSPGMKKYYGVWERYNMPMSTVHGLESYSRLALRHGRCQKRADGDWMIDEKAK